MWEVYEPGQVSRRFSRLPDEALRRYEKWKDIVRVSGPSGLRLIQGFRDETLRGEWKGYRSSRLALQYRVIYKIEAQEVAVYVIDLTAHDYRSRCTDGQKELPKSRPNN